MGYPGIQFIRQTDKPISEPSSYAFNVIPLLMNDGSLSVGSQASNLLIDDGEGREVVFYMWDLEHWDLEKEVLVAPPLIDLEAYSLSFTMHNTPTWSR